MHRSVQVASLAGMVGLITVLSVGMAWASGGAERVDVAVFELQGEGIDDELLEILSGVLRREAQQHEGYSLANPAAIRRDEVALVVGCDPDQTECLRTMADFVDGQVLIFGEVVDEGDALVISIDILDAAGSEEPVRVRRRIEEVKDPVVSFRREVEKIFSDLDSIGETHLLVEAPGDDIPIRLEDVVVGRGTVERRGMRPGQYRVVVGEGNHILWEGSVDLEPGQLVEVRPEARRDEASPTGDDGEAEMAVAERTVKPGETSAPSEPIEYEGRRSNLPGYSMMGTGALALAGSGVMALLMQRVEGQIDDEASQGTLDQARYDHLVGRGETYQTTHYVLLGVGLGALVAGGGWVGWNYFRNRSNREDLDDGVAIYPTWRGLAIEGRW